MGFVIPLWSWGYFIINVVVLCVVYSYDQIHEVAYSSKERITLLKLDFLELHIRIPKDYLLIFFTGILILLYWPIYELKSLLKQTEEKVNENAWKDDMEIL